MGINNIGIDTLISDIRKEILGVLPSKTIFIARSYHKYDIFYGVVHYDTLTSKSSNSDLFSNIEDLFNVISFVDNNKYTAVVISNDGDIIYRGNKSYLNYIWVGKHLMYDTNVSSDDDLPDYIRSCFSISIVKCVSKLFSFNTRSTNKRWNRFCMCFQSMIRRFGGSLKSNRVENGEFILECEWKSHKVVCTVHTI